MQKFEITVLGASSATPTSKRNPTSQLVNVADRYFLVDCGEGTQSQLRRFKIKFQRINHILISHLHGDHYFGLIGLLSSMHLLGRVTDLHLYAQPALKEIIDLQLKHSETRFNYNLIFHPIDATKQKIIFEDDKLTVETIVLNHRIPCTGFLFREKDKPRKIMKAAISKYKLAPSDIARVRLGEDFTTKEGATIPNDEITGGALHCYSYAYCSDTCYDERVIAQVRNVDFLYHEATFLDDMKPRAKATFHTTALEAATVAQKANVKQLMIGHYSARYNDFQPLLEEAQTHFPATVLAIEGERYRVDKE